MMTRSQTRIAELEARIAELEKENKPLKKENEKLTFLKTLFLRPVKEYADTDSRFLAADLLTLTFSKKEFEWATEWSDDKWDDFKEFVNKSDSIYDIVKEDLLEQLMDILTEK